MSDAVTLEVDAHVATLRLSREAERNAMTPELLDAFEDGVRRVRDDPDVRVVVVTGTGRHFCSGADFRTTAELMARSGFVGPAGRRESTRRIYAAFLGLLELDVPVIAAVNGHAIGGGLGLALAADVRVVSTEAKLGANFTRLGLHPGMAITCLLPRAVGAERAAELLFTGRLVTGAEAVELGLARHAVPAPEVLPRATALAREMAVAAPWAVRLTKRSLQVATLADARRAVEIEAYAQALCADTEDVKEGIAALLQKREPKFTGR